METTKITEAELNEAADEMLVAEATEWAALLDAKVEKVGNGLGVDITDGEGWTLVSNLLLARLVESGDEGRRCAVNMMAAGLVLATIDAGRVWI